MARTKAATMEGEAVVAGVRITHPDRVLYPETGLTKLGLASYYHDVAKWMLPYLAGRPLALVRCPQGQAGQCFYQKHLGAGAPESLHTVAIQEKSKTSQYAIVEDVAGLVSLAQIGILEIHTWGSRADSIEKPDVLVFDLDPDADLDWSKVIAATQELREFLESLGLRSFLKTTGGKGLHIVAPIRRRHEWPEIKQFAHDVVASMESRSPRLYTTNMSKAKRGGKIYLDYLRNERGATFVCAYSTRAKPGASVSVPLDWSELSTAIRSDHFHVDNVRARLKSLDTDPWADFFELKQSLTAAAIKKVRPLKRRAN